MAMLLSGIADEAGRQIERQIEAHRLLEFDYIEMRFMPSLRSLLLKFSR